MPVIYPADAISQRWNGALEIRLRQAPLERFLRENGVNVAPSGTSQASDNLLRATVFIVEQTLQQQRQSSTGPVCTDREAAVSHLACLVARALAGAIAAPLEWRVAALRGTAQLLRGRGGLCAAAVASASFVRAYEAQSDAPLCAADARISALIRALLEATVGAAAEADWVAIASHLEPAASDALPRVVACAIESGAQS